MFLKNYCRVFLLSAFLILFSQFLTLNCSSCYAAVLGQDDFNDQNFAAADSGLSNCFTWQVVSGSFGTAGNVGHDAGATVFTSPYWLTTGGTSTPMYLVSDQSMTPNYELQFDVHEHWTDAGGTDAGPLMLYQDTRNHYRLKITQLGGLSIYRVMNGAVTLVGTNHPEMGLPYGFSAARYKIKVLNFAHSIRFECQRSNLVNFTNGLDTGSMGDVTECVIEDTASAAVSLFGTGGKVGFYAAALNGVYNICWWDNLMVNSVDYDTVNPPAVPSDLTASAVHTARIDLNWTDNSTNETGFRIERSLDNQTFTEIDSLILNKTSYENIAGGLAAGRTYYYRVKAYNSNGDSVYSNTAQATTVAIPAATALKGWELTSANTGLPGVGLSYDMLEDYTGPNPPLAGSVITEKHITTIMDLNADNITFVRCSFRPSTVGQGSPICSNSNESPVHFIDCDIDGTGVTNDNLVAYTMGFSGCAVFQRCRIFGVGTGIGFSGNVTTVVDGVYIYGLRAGTLPQMSSPSHNDGFTTRSFSYPEMIIRNSRIDCSSGHDTGALFLQPTFGFLNNILIEGNLLEGNGYTLILENRGYHYGTNVRAVNNRFNPSGYGPGYVDGGCGWFEWRDNYRHDGSQPDGKGEWIPEIRCAVNGSITVPGNFQAVPAGYNRIKLSWQDNSGNELGFRIERRLLNGTFAAAAMVGSNVTSCYDAGLAPGTTYYYRVASFNNDGPSNFSPETSVETLEEGVDSEPPSVPLNLSGVPVSANQITLAWTASTDDIWQEGYEVYRDGVLIGSTSGNNYADTGLISNTDYSYQVLACDYAGNKSEKSNAITASTKFKPVTAPVSAITKYEGEKIELDITVTDLNVSDTLTLSPSGMPDGSAVAPRAGVVRTWRFTWQTDFNDAGVYPVVFTANDGELDSDPVTVNVTVSEVGTSLQVTDHKEWN